MVQLDSIELKAAAFAFHHCQPQYYYFTMKKLDIALEDIGIENIDIEDIDTEQFVDRLDSIELKEAAFFPNHYESI